MMGGPEMTASGAEITVPRLEMIVAVPPILVSGMKMIIRVWPYFPGRRAYFFPNALAFLLPPAAETPWKSQMDYWSNFRDGR